MRPGSLTCLAPKHVFTFGSTSNSGLQKLPAPQDPPGGEFQGRRKHCASIPGLERAQGPLASLRLRIFPSTFCFALGSFLELLDDFVPLWSSEVERNFEKNASAWLLQVAELRTLKPP